MAVVGKEKEELKNKVAGLPEAAGVYIFKDKGGRVLYIGKAKSLKKRLQSYFSRYLCAKTQVLLEKVADIEYILSPSESQAQLLEASLIKENLPPYNISLRDDKSFPFIRITNEDSAVVYICRKKKVKIKDSATYFGPYTNAKLLRKALKTIRRAFTFRSCRVMPKRPCLYYRLKLCPAPCVGEISKKQYQEIIGRIKFFLESRYSELIDMLAKEMKRCAQERRFEAAARLRDQISALGVIQQTKAPMCTVDELEDLKNLAHLNKVPLRIEAFDISNISGKEATGAMVSFYKGLPDKSNYRRFRIKTFRGIDDYRMLKEVIQRRYSRALKENLSLPGLIIVDGGRSHLMVADKEMKKLRLDIPLLSIAKDKENMYIKNTPKPVRLNSDIPALNLIRRIRDEAHRFALAYHHLLRRKNILGR
ncbi:MAG: excinuclease ABC subunit UvrC [Candidatus Omnitrophica bacterium]|nr:excinuclease ABC subunit UvrC [Candidatus Omnitrophota bacterium]MBU4473483.1 excinuclease ABC subunit UvrC [Candidatus Omnitrophota bacterium]MCG2706922.1 excinuclease ABC subunit UvrC [Candidatus Omnitrophota bacterium]